MQVAPTEKSLELSKKTAAVSYGLNFLGAFPTLWVGLSLYRTAILQTTRSPCVRSAFDFVIPAIEPESTRQSPNPSGFHP